MISVIIPCYNCEALVKRSVESVLNQASQDYELLLVDNGSTDGTLRILNEYQQRHPELVSVYQEPNKGGAYARNKGLRHAKGQWLQFLDADDELLPFKLANQSALGEDSGADVVVGGYIHRIYTKAKYHEFVHHVNKSVWKGLIFSELGKTSSNLWRKSALLKAGGWNTEQTSSQEYELLFRLLQNGSYIVYDPAVLTVIHCETNSVSKSSDPGRLAGILRNRIDLRLKIREYLAANGYLTQEIDQLIDTYIYHELKIHYRKVPDFADRFLKGNKLNVPLRDKLKIDTYVVGKQIRKLIRAI